MKFGMHAACGKETGVETTQEHKCDYLKTVQFSSQWISNILHNTT